MNIIKKIKSKLQPFSDKNNQDEFYEKITPIELSPYTNIYHCCTWKSASQWFLKFFKHPIVYSHTGLDTVSILTWHKNLQQQGYSGIIRPDDLKFILEYTSKPEMTFPQDCFAANIYFSYEAYSNIPKPKKYKTFFVMRDPRDIVVSYYFSMRDSHRPFPWVLKERAILNNLTKDDGLKYCIKSLERMNIFADMISWKKQSNKDSNIKIFSYEQLVKEPTQFLKDLLMWFEININDDNFANLNNDLSFKKLTGGRAKGEENTESHLRKGIHGDWENYFSPEVKTYFYETTNDLVEYLGYI